MTRKATVWLLFVVAACGREALPTPPPECATVWNGADASDLIEQLLQATGADRNVWTDYDVGDGAYVLFASVPDSSGTCVGIWQDGRALSFALTAEQPGLLTPLYGYYFRSDWYGGSDDPMVEESAQPLSVRTWLESTGVQSAIILPVTVRDFPIELSALVKVQLAMHEAFHVDVQGPRWWASTGNWPTWDEQPDRSGLQACYAANDEVAAAFEAERQQLVSLIESLLDSDTATACESCRAFLAQRMARYEMLADVHVLRQDSTEASCAEAEAILEIEEGTADFASWTVLYDLGLASRELLIRRYSAIQNDAFYMTGNMQLHAVQLMQPDSMMDVMRRIAESTGPDDGSPTAVLARALESFCPRPR